MSPTLRNMAHACGTQAPTCRLSQYLNDTERARRIDLLVVQMNTAMRPMKCDRLFLVASISWGSRKCPSAPPLCHIGRYGVADMQATVRAGFGGVSHGQGNADDWGLRSGWGGARQLAACAICSKCAVSTVVSSEHAAQPQNLIMPRLPHRLARACYTLVQEGHQ